MSLDGHIGSTKSEAREQDRACFIQGWTHQAMLRAMEEQGGEYPQLEKLSDLNKNVTYLTPEVKKLDEEIDELQEKLASESLVAQFFMAIRRACREAIEEDKNLYFFGSQEPAEEEEEGKA